MLFPLPVLDLHLQHTAAVNLGISDRPQRSRLFVVSILQKAFVYNEQIKELD